MNVRQKKLVAHIITVTAFTAAVVTGFANIKNAINRSEAVRAMELLGNETLRYRKTYNSLPPEYYIKRYKDEIVAVRLPDIYYRAPWIEFGSDPNRTILAYSKKNYRGLVKAGYVVLWLNGRVEWMNKKQFEQILTTQQKQQELKWLKENLQEQRQY